MHALRSPHEAYRRVEFDARVEGANPRQLVLVCYDQLTAALGRALHGAKAGDNRLKSEALTRALAAIAALQMGIDPAAPIASALTQFLGAARRTLLDCVLDFDPEVVARLQKDFSEIRNSLERAEFASRSE